MPISGEYFDLKVYRNNVLVFDDTNEVISFEVEQTCTAERGEARIRFDGDNFPNIKAGDAVELYACSSGTILTKIFSGEIEDINKTREEGELFYDVIVHDWSKLLSERKVNLSFPSVENVKTIALNIVEPISSGTVPPNYNERKISINNVESMNKTRTIDFIGLTMYEALKKLSDYTLCDFYVDPDKDLNWFLRTSRGSEKTLGENDLQTYDIDTNRSVCNQAIVYGAANRTAPEYNEDFWSDSKVGWFVAEEGSAETINVSKVPTEYSNEAYPGWTKYRNYAEQTQDLKVEDFEIVKKEWAVSGESPWLKDTETDSISCVSAWSEGKKMEYWTWQDPNESNFRTNLKEWKNVDLKFKAKQAPDDSQVFWAPCYSLDEFTGYTGNVFAGGYDSGHTLKVWTGGSYSGGSAWKNWDEATANIKATFDLRLPSTTNYLAGDKIFLLTLNTIDEMGSIRAQLYIEIVGGKWRFRLRGWDRNLVFWKVEDTKDASGWYYGLTLSIAGANTSNATVKFTGGPLTLTKTGIDMSENRIKSVRFQAYWEYTRSGAEDYVLYRRVTPASALSIRCTRRITNFKASLFKWKDYTWKDYDFFFEDSDLSWTEKEIDIKGDFSDYDLLQGIRLKLTCYSSAGIPTSVGKIVFRHAWIFLKADVYYGSPVYLDTDDGDLTSIEASEENLEDYAWTDFEFSLGGMTEFYSSTITVKGRNSGTIDVSCKLKITDPTTGSEIDLGTKTWTASETTYTEKKWDVSSYLNTEYNLQHTRLKFIKIGTGGSLRLSYTHIDVRYLRITGAFITEDSTIKKAGYKSIKLFYAGEGSPGTLTSSFWRDLPESVACQTIDHKEGFIKLNFAALIDMYIYSTLSHWERPSAKLNSFQVSLRDSNGNKISYSGGDLYPETTFYCTPGPKQTKMKEISIPVGENAEANGGWTRLGSDFNWASVNRIEFSLSGATDTSLEGNPYLSNIQLWIDWLHFDEGKWFSDYALADNSVSVLTYGRCVQDVFDQTCFSEEDCFYRAKYYVESHKYPTTYIENVEIDYPQMELLNPGEIVHFELPEGNFTVRITKITWIWDGNLFGKLDLDNEGSQPAPCPAEGEKITNGDFQTVDFTGWDQEDCSIYAEGGCPPTTFYCHCPYSTSWIQQNIEGLQGESIPVECITSFTFLAKQCDCPTADVKVIITYSDSSTSEHTFTISGFSWAQYDIKPYLTSGKNVAKIKFDAQDNCFDLDDISLVV